MRSFSIIVFFTSALVICACASNLAAESSEIIDDDVIAAMMERHCVSCHAANPSDPIYQYPAGGLSLETLDGVRNFAWEIRLQTVDSDLMPLGNTTGMTDSERKTLGAWLDQQDE
ncbi:hypothetical protein PUV54_09375 [Hyphococcus flavus]|uniref:Cytochrome c domain-containing protein n=1 Tax=Hyphococcus flavus TaxID=1866326 RepID=A0AAE9ZA13_9PROT|nr:hypothetical protein [Hyphococcus flavus]WDI30169.1 hypothetical protein PUV54_09375 [Hyphococcus flavus]